MARAPCSQRLSWGCDLKRAAAAALLPSDPLVDVAGAHGYKHAQPQRTRQMPLATLARWTRRVRASAGARTRGAGAPRKNTTPVARWPTSTTQRIPLRVKGARLPTVAGRNLAAVVVLLPTRGLFKRARAPQPPSRRWS